MRLRIGVDMHSLDGIHQGIKTHCFELFSRAVRVGSDIDFVCFVGDPARMRQTSEAFSLPNVAIVEMPKRSSLYRLLVQLPSLAGKHRLDLLHCQYIVPPFSPCPTAVSIHDTLFESHPEYFKPLFRWRSRIMMRRSAVRSALVCTGSKFSERELIARYSLDSGHVCTIGNGVDRDRFHPGLDGHDKVVELGLASGGYLLSVGRLEPRKNHIGIVRAFARLDTPRPKLVIAGQRDFNYDGVFAAIRELNLQDEVAILENLDDDKLAAVYRHALLFLYPSWAEGFGLPLLEAMASGVPVITSNNTSLGEVGADAALYALPESPESISAAIGKVLSDTGLRDDLIGRGLRRAAEYNWEDVAVRLVESYRRILRASPARNGGR
jgi:glycosyltransferase involved in cell wall biosynthesis